MCRHVQTRRSARARFKALFLGSRCTRSCFRLSCAGLPLLKASLMVPTLSHHGTLRTRSASHSPSCSASFSMYCLPSATEYLPSSRQHHLSGAAELARRESGRKASCSCRCSASSSRQDPWSPVKPSKHPNIKKSGGPKPDKAGNPGSGLTERSLQEQAGQP